MKKIKNLKIFKSKIITKAKFTLATLGIMSSFMVGCSGNKQNNDSMPAIPATVTTTEIEATTSYPVKYDNPELLEAVELLEEEETYEEELSDEVLSKLNERVELSEESYNTINEYIKNVDVEYEYSDLYGVDEALEHYENIGKSYENNELKLIKNNKVDSNELYKVVLNNNKNIPDKVIVMDNAKIKEVVDIVCDQINKKLASSKNISYSNLDYTLSNLRIFDYKNFGTAYVNMDEPILAINLLTIDSLQETNTDTNVFEVTVRHEADHLIQVSYSKDKSYETNLGICYSFEDLDINSINWKWFYEGSAEKLTLDKNQEPYVYQGEVRALETLTMSTILDDSVDENDIEELSLQHNLDKLFEKFNANTIDEKREIINMMFSYDLALNNTEEFSEQYKEKFNEKLDVYKKDEVKNSVLSSVGQTLTKTFYTNLTNCIYNNDMSVEDIFSLISLYETKMNSVLRFSDINNQQEKISFFETYSNIQLQFFDELAKSINADSIELRSLYCNYHNSNVDNNYNYNFLTNDENSFLNEIDNNSQYFTTKTIIDCKVR